MKDVVVPSVAELPTRQYTLLPRPPPMTLMLELLPVVSVLPMLKMKTAFGLPSELSVSVPFSCAAEAKL
ncbi:MAG TPA: hypothetical protein VMQ54_07440 [Steroidobacteraceae bacterium]|nr:hypothetical protein [Steroidobacteraceae bacterium]